MNIKAIIVGNIVDVLGTMLTTFVIAIGAVLIGSLFKNSLSPEMYALLSGPKKLRPVYIGIGMLFSVLGGFVSARIAKEKEILYGALSTILCFILGIVSIARAYEFNIENIAHELLTIGLGILGGFICLKVKEKGQRPTVLS